MAFFPADPIQPFWVLNSVKYYKKISSVPAIAHYYRFHTSSGAQTSFAVPDGAVDIIIECGCDHLNARICGTVNHGSLPGFEENKTYFGIRLHPEAIDHIGNAPVADLAGHEYRLEDLVHSADFLKNISEEVHFEKQADLFEKAFLESTSPVIRDDSVHRLSMSIIAEIYKSNGLVRVSDLEDILHYSRRHLTRCFTLTMGVDIKSFANYVRFQYILRGIRDGVFKSASDAAMAGSYYDQSHFQKDFRNFTNTTPRAMIKLFQESNYAKRITLYT